MRDARDITTVDEAAWTEAVARELVLRSVVGASGRPETAAQVHELDCLTLKRERNNT